MRKIKELKKKIQNVETKICFNLEARKTKMIVDFNDRESARIKSVAGKIRIK